MVAEGRWKRWALDDMVLNAHEDAMAKLRLYLDPVFPPSRRAAITAQLCTFAATRPVLASLVIAQLAFSGIPLMLFVLFALGTLLFSLTAALAVGVLCALVFTATCVGFATLVLVPVVMGTTVVGLTTWCWAWVGWYLVRWFGFLGGREGVTKAEGKDQTEAKPRVGQNGYNGQIPTSG